MLYACGINVLYEISVSTIGIYVPLFLTLTFSFSLKKNIFNLFKLFGFLEQLIAISNIRIYVTPFITLTFLLVIFKFLFQINLLHLYLI